MRNVRYQFQFYSNKLSTLPALLILFLVLLVMALLPVILIGITVVVVAKSLTSGMVSRITGRNNKRLNQ